MLSGIAKRAIPFLVRTVAPEAMQMGKAVLSDVLEGRQLRESLRNRGITAAKGVGRRIIRGGRIMKKRTKVKRGRKSKKKKTRKRQLKRKSSRACYKGDIFSMPTLV